MNFDTLATITIAAFFIGFAFGFAACFYGVKIRNANREAPSLLAGNYAIYDSSGMMYLDTHSSNPSTSWSQFLKTRPSESIKSLKGKGFRAKKIPAQLL